MKKNFCAFGLFAAPVLISSLVSAATITVKSDSNKELLQPLPQQTIGILADSGYKLTDIGNGVFEVKIRDLHCDSRHRGYYDDKDPLAGIPTDLCRTKSKNVQDTKKGRPFKESRALINILKALESEGNVVFGDCAMGYCGTWSPAVVCTVDTKIQDFAAGRFTCTYTDGQ